MRLYWDGIDNVCRTDHEETHDAFRIVDGKGNLVAWIGDVETAALMSAAPAMLEALRKIKVECSPMTRERWFTDIASKAIALATAPHPEMHPEMAANVAAEDGNE